MVRFVRLAGPRAPQQWSLLRLETWPTTGKTSTQRN